MDKIYSIEARGMLYGGTRLSAPIWAGRATASGAVVSFSCGYGSSITYRDITSGNNGAACVAGFDLCTGRGSWPGAIP